MRCPNCDSPRNRRGGSAIWTVYMVLIALAMPFVLVWRFNAAIFALVMIAVVLLTHLIVKQRVCLDCGEQFRP